MKNVHYALTILLWASFPGLAYLGDPTLFGPEYHGYVALFLVVWGLIATTIVHVLYRTWGLLGLPSVGSSAA